MVVPVIKLPTPAFEIRVAPLSVNAPAEMATFPAVAVMSPEAEVMPMAPVMAPPEEMSMLGVLRKLVKPLAEEKVMPLTVPPEPATRFTRFDVLVPEEGLAAAPSVIVMPFTASPAPVLLFLNVKLARLAEAEARRFAVKLFASPDVPVEVMDKAGLVTPDTLNPPVPWMSPLPALRPTEVKLPARFRAVDHWGREPEEVRTVFEAPIASFASVEALEA